jgi:hypothetical protein
MKLHPERKATLSNVHSFPIALRTFSRVVMAITVRFSLRANRRPIHLSRASMIGHWGVGGRSQIALGQRADCLDRFL